MDLTYALSAIIGIIGIFLLALTYTYIDKLEKIGCDCSVHPYRKYIKGYCIFAVVYIFLMFLLPVSWAIKNLGKSAAGVYFLANLAFVILTVIFFVYSLIYTRYLMKEKCKCSEDARRQILYLWSLIEVILFALIFIVQILLLLAAVTVGAASGMIDIVNKDSSLVKEAVVNPVKSIQRIPGAVKSLPKSFKKFKSLKK